MTESELKPASIPVGVIGAGSTNAVAFTVHGTDDPVTGIIHIVLGGALSIDVGAVQNHSGEISKFIVGQMSYGYLADIMLHSEDLRWMGPRRYDYAGWSQKLLQCFCIHRSNFRSAWIKIHGFAHFATLPLT
jgi:diacylglycerol kinase family enzyme